MQQLLAVAELSPCCFCLCVHQQSFIHFPCVPVLGLSARLQSGEDSAFGLRKASARCMSRLIPAAVEEGCALCSSPSPAQCLRLFLCIHPGVYVIALLCAFIYCFLITSGTEHLIICLLVIWISSLLKYLFISKSVFNPDGYTSKAKPVALSGLQ